MGLKILSPDFDYSGFAKLHEQKSTHLGGPGPLALLIIFMVFELSVINFLCFSLIILLIA